MKNTKYTRLLLLLAFCFAMAFNFNFAYAKTKLETPKNFKGTVEITEDYETVLTVTWDKVSGAEGYEVYYRSLYPDPNEDIWEDWFLISKTNKRKAEGSIIDGVFQMRVRAYKGSSYSDYTDVITVLSGEGIISNPKIKLNKTSKSVYVGKSFKLELLNATDPVELKSGDSKIASVSKDGKVKGLKKGTVTITATSNGKKYTCKVTVKELSKKDQAVNAYKDFLKKKLKEDKNFEYYYFAVDDLTGDGVPELFIGSSKNYWGTYSERYLVYTYKDNKVVSLFYMDEHEGTWVVLYDKKNHYFIVEGPPTPSQYYLIYQYKSGKLKMIKETDDYSIYKKYSANAKLPDYIEITEKNINNMKY